MIPVLSLFDFSGFWLAHFTQKQPSTCNRLVVSQPETLIEMIHSAYQDYTQSCMMAASNSAEQWMETFLETQFEKLEQESDIVDLPVVAQNWLDELPGLLQRRAQSIPQTSEG